MARVTVVVWLVAVSLSVAACGESTAVPTAAPIVARGEASGFVLEVHLPSATFASSDAIAVTTRLTWMGAAPTAKIFGSGSGPVAFDFTEVGGSHRTMGGLMTADCGMDEFARGVPVDIPLRKSGGWIGEDPQAAFYEAWFADKDLHLPAGHWQLSVSAVGYLAPCDQAAPRLDLQLQPIDLLVQ